MSTRTLLITLSASMLLGASVAAPNAALAQLGPPPGPPPMLAGPPPGLAGGPPPGLAGGPPPGLAGGPPLGGPPAGPVTGLPPRGPAGAPPRDIAAGPPRLDGAGGLHGLDRGGQANFRGIEGRAAAYGANSYTRNSYASYSHGYGYGYGYGYGNGYGRGYRFGSYAAAAAYAYGRSYASSDGGCTYVSTSRGYGFKRILVCHGD